MAAYRIFGLRCRTVILLAFSLTIAVEILGRTSPRIATFTGDLTFAAYVVLAALLLPARGFAMLTIGFAGCWTSVKLISDAKINLTRLPLTMLDVKIAAGNPQGLLTAIGAPLWVRSTLLLIVLTGAIFVVWQTKRLVIGLIATKELWRVLLSMGCIGLLVVHFSSRQVQLVGDRIESGSFNVWNPDAVSVLARRVGPLTFLAFTREVGRRRDAVFFSTESDAPVPSEIVSATVRKYVATIDAASSLPNIVLVHLESTFDPNKAFALKVPVINALFEHTDRTRSLGQLRVNAVGGGSWVTEFEVLTGIDSRLFGYSGFYTHSSLAPYVETAFPAYLRAKGYRTSAYHSWPGGFYNTRSAFLKYGFDEFADVEDLGVMNRRDFYKFIAKDPDDLDLRIAEAAVAKMSRATETQPFFAFVGFGQNHGPHPCGHFDSVASFRTTLRGTDDFGINCELNEYVRRLDGTARAFDRLRDFLEERETTTGRPYVMLGYGDHQPHTFTSIGGFAANDYSRFRTTASIKETSYRIDSSISAPLGCCGNAVVPATLVPSILSAYVARNESDLYLSINFYLFDRCGPDIGQNDLIGLSLRGHQLESSSSTCETLRRALPLIRRSGVLRYP